MMAGVHSLTCLSHCVVCVSRGRAGRHHERAEEEAEDKELVADELQEAEVKQSWPDHLEEQPTCQQQHTRRQPQQYSQCTSVSRCK